MRVELQTVVKLADYKVNTPRIRVLRDERNWINLVITERTTLKRKTKMQ